MQKAPKILLPDISGNSLLFIDEGRFYPLHNIYYITGEDIHQLKILCSILMSDFVRKQIQRISNNMNGGYARWQSQNLRKLRIPDIKGLSHEQAAILEEGYEKKDIKLINDCISYLTQKQYLQERVSQPGSHNNFRLFSLKQVGGVRSECDFCGMEQCVDTAHYFLPFLSEIQNNCVTL